MEDFQHKQEIERLARTLRQSRVASSESDAFRMATEMLATSKKVHDDHKMREQKLYGDHLPNAEQKKAHMIMEKLSENLAKGKSNVRIDVNELNQNIPLKNMVHQEEQPEEVEEDDAILVNDDSLKESAEVSEAAHTPVVVDSHKVHADEEDDSTEDDDETHEEESETEGKSDESEEFTIREI